MLSVVAVLLCIAGSIALGVAANSDTGKKVFSVVNAGVKMAAKGQNAPGAAEVRAAGCPQATIFNIDDMLEFVELIVDAGTRDAGVSQDVMVLCQGTVFQHLPDCDEVAKAYAGAVKSDKTFSVSVMRQGKQKPVCRRRYASDGRPLGLAE